MKEGLYKGRLECYSVSKDRQAVLRGVGVLLFAACCSVSAVAEVVRAELGENEVWTGQAVPLFVTLYSPGPFSGTASFDLPELPLTTFVKVGNPTVGSEQIGDDSYFTQRHEFALYTQRDGPIFIPAFCVRFAGKKSFTSAAEPVEGFTQELRFQSTRPPGTERLGVVVAARNMEASQTWQPDAIGPVQAGDVIARTISRRATDTTAMMFPPVAIETPPGVRSYATDPIVQDSTERGAIRAERSETIKYQFERAGTFELPELAVIWWDPDARELRRQLLPGRLIDVQNEAVVADTLAPTPRSPWPAVVLSLTIGTAAWLARKPARRLLADLQTRRNDPATVAARRLLAACRTSAAAEAYAALLQWQRVVTGSSGAASLVELLPPDAAAEFEYQWHLLSRHVFGNASGGPAWRGQRLAEVFVQVRRKLNRAPRAAHADVDLPALNPTCSSD